METGEHHIIKANITVLATGAGTIFESNNAYINTGDGIGMALRAEHQCKI